MSFIGGAEPSYTEIPLAPAGSWIMHAYTCTHTQYLSCYKPTIPPGYCT